MNLAHPSRLFALLTALGLVALASAPGCAAPIAPDDTEEGATALAEDELEAAVLVDKVPSRAPAITRVDTWRLSIVEKKGAPKPFLVAIGRQGTKEVIDVVFAANEAGETGVRIATTEDRKLTPELHEALKQDLLAIRDVLDPGYAAREGGVGTRTLRPLGGDPEVECAKEYEARHLTAGLAIFTLAGVLACTTSMMASAGATTGMCIVYGSVFVERTFAYGLAQTRLNRCVEEVRTDAGR